MNKKKFRLFLKITASLLLVCSILCIVVFNSSKKSAKSSFSSKTNITNSNNIDEQSSEIPTPTISTTKITNSPKSTRSIVQSKNPSNVSTQTNSGAIHTGKATFYGGGYSGGCCMLDPVSTQYYVTAMNTVDYDHARLAGAYIKVTGPKGTIKLLVTDLLPEGKKGDLDLNKNAFPLIANPINGIVPVTWQIIPLEFLNGDTTIKFRFKEGSSAYWTGVQVRNHRYPVAKFEYMVNGKFVEVKREDYNYFVINNIGAGPFTFRVTDIYGQSVVESNIALKPTQVVNGKTQFPLK